jgi:phosphonate transport system permease protein
VSDSLIDQKLRQLERIRFLRQALAIVFTTGVVVATYFGLQFLQFEFDTILQQLETQRNFILDFFPINFVDFSIYSKQNEITGFAAVIATFLNPGSLVNSLVSTEGTLLRLSVITIVIGFTGTVLGFPLALTFGILGSERVTPFPFNFLFRGTMSAIRAIPALVWVLIYVPLVGLNPSGAVLAVATDTIGNMGRLFTDELEEIEDGPIEAISSTGASRTQVISFGMLSQVFRSFIAWALYILEINVRIAISLGVVGAGGIGRYIRLRQDLFKYPKMAAGIVMVFFIVISVELFSSRVRARLRPSEHEGKSLSDVLRGLADPTKWFGVGRDRRS